MKRNYVNYASFRYKYYQCSDHRHCVKAIDLIVEGAKDTQD
ncbi:MAG: hypothetical protein V7784_18780 [Oceanospirillaceae bacterium]